MEELKKNGYNPSKIKREKLLSGQTITDLTNGKMIAITSIGKVCVMLRCQPGYIIESVITDEEKIKFF
jgi:DNA-binding Xre family transcriptional regulator